MILFLNLSREIRCVKSNLYCIYKKSAGRHRAERESFISSFIFFLLANNAACVYLAIVTSRLKQRKQKNTKKKTRGMKKNYLLPPFNNKYTHREREENTQKLGENVLLRVRMKCAYTLSLSLSLVEKSALLWL